MKPLHVELMGSSRAEKDQQVANVNAFRDTHAEEAKSRLKELQKVRVSGKTPSPHALYDVGGEYRRNM